MMNIDVNNVHSARVSFTKMTDCAGENVKPGYRVDLFYSTDSNECAVRDDVEITVPKFSAVVKLLKKVFVQN